MEESLDFFVKHILVSKAFLVEKFGETDYLKLKNSGVIPHKEHNVKNSQVKGYSFHGYGCSFNFKNFEIDVEFEDDLIGFTCWAFYIFLKRRNEEVDSKEVCIFLDNQLEKGKLKKGKKIYFPI